MGHTLWLKIKIIRKINLIKIKLEHYDITMGTNNTLSMSVRHICLHDCWILLQTTLLVYVLTSIVGQSRRNTDCAISNTMPSQTTFPYDI